MFINQVAIIMFQNYFSHNFDSLPVGIQASFCQLFKNTERAKLHIWTKKMGWKEKARALGSVLHGLKWPQDDYPIQNSFNKHMYTPLGTRDQKLQSEIWVGLEVITVTCLRGKPFPHPKHDCQFCTAYCKQVTTIKWLSSLQITRIRNASSTHSASGHS